MNEDGDVLIEGRILDESDLYVMDPAYFSDYMETLHVAVVGEIDTTTAFAGMADVVDEIEKTEEERDRSINTDWWYRYTQVECCLMTIGIV